jgi:hypothetical protein
LTNSHSSLVQEWNQLNKEIEEKIRTRVGIMYFKFQIVYCEFESRSWRGVLYTTLCDEVCHRLAADQWSSPGTLDSPTHKTDCHNIDEILLKVALNPTTLTLTHTNVTKIVYTICVLIKTDPEQFYEHFLSLSAL